MGDIPELPGHLDSTFSPVSAEEVDGMVNVGGSELGWTPSRIFCGIWTVLRPDTADISNPKVSL